MAHSRRVRHAGAAKAERWAASDDDDPEHRLADGAASAAQEDHRPQGLGGLLAAGDASGPAQEH